MNSFSAATRASEDQNGSTKEGSVKIEKTADCALPSNGRPDIRWGFHNGTSGASRRRNCV
jgi:hypothetical protein